MKVLIEFMTTFLLTTIQVYAWYKIVGDEKFRISIYNILAIVVLSIYSIINFNYIDELLKPVFMFIVALLCCKMLLKRNFITCFIVVFCQYILIIIFEAIIISVFLCFFGNDVNYLLNNYLVSLIVDLFMCILIIITLNLKVPNKLYNFIVVHASNLKNSQILKFLIIAVLCSLTIFAQTYFNNNVMVALIINIIITIIYIIIITIIIKTKNNYMTVIGKYHTSLDTLQAQESIISDYRILNHENKNNLMTIKSLSKSKKVNKYIDSLLNQQEKLKNKIIDETLKLPEGGIRGLIYNKLTLIKEYNIPYYLNVDKKINYKSLSNISDEDIVDVCQILGVFIDNAIDESNLIDDKQINIDLHLNNNEFIISIANHYNKKLNINNLKTTKGKGHGYGLKLVKKIIESNNKIHTKKEINKDLFIQKIYIKR